jgi:hypothetical protein
MPAFIKGIGAGLKTGGSINFNINFSMSKNGHGWIFAVRW